MTSDELLVRLRRLEDRAEIKDLQARYTLYIDVHDLAKVGPLFARDGVFRSNDGVMRAVGPDAVCEQYRGRFDALRFGFHVTHDHLIEFDPRDPDRATGMVSSHAEVVRNGTPMLAGMRYFDVYAREDGTWRFADRNLHFFYYLPIADYLGAVTGRDRMRAYGDARPADMPEGAATYGRSRAGRSA